MFEPTEFTTEDALKEISGALIAFTEEYADGVGLELDPDTGILKAEVYGDFNDETSELEIEQTLFFRVVRMER